MQIHRHRHRQKHRHRHRHRHRHTNSVVQMKIVEKDTHQHGYACRYKVATTHMMPYLYRSSSKKGPIISGSVAENNLQIEASYVSSPLCTHGCAYTRILVDVQICTQNVHTTSIHVPTSSFLTAYFQNETWSTPSHVRACVCEYVHMRACVWRCTCVCVCTHILLSHITYLTPDLCRSKRL